VKKAGGKNFGLLLFEFNGLRRAALPEGAVTGVAFLL
jgi:hypothetical protein